MTWKEEGEEDETFPEKRCPRASPRPVLWATKLRIREAKRIRMLGTARGLLTVSKDLSNKKIWTLMLIGLPEILMVTISCESKVYHRRTHHWFPTGWRSAVQIPLLCSQRSATSLTPSHWNRDGAHSPLFVSRKRKSRVRGWGCSGGVRYTVKFPEHVYTECRDEGRLKLGSCWLTAIHSPLAWGNQ